MGSHESNYNKLKSLLNMCNELVLFEEGESVLVVFETDVIRF